MVDWMFWQGSLIIKKMNSRGLDGRVTSDSEGGVRGFLGEMFGMFEARRSGRELAIKIKGLGE